MEWTQEQKAQLHEKLMGIAQERGFNSQIGIRLTSIAEGCVKGELDVTADTLNALGIVHGGALAALADTAAGFAVASLGLKGVTSNYSMTYLRATSSGRLFCTAQIRKAGSRLCIAQASITNDAGQDVALGTFHFAVLGDLEV